ncbi:MAG: protein-glutamate O-methyltransferase CheR [Candidatus Scalindua sp.]|nr:protein-glutamate O-methyltransferase CheR [Candidatus Scalindua sp.]
MKELSNSEKIECDLLLQAIFMKYGYDFRNYTKPSIRRRIHNRLTRYNLKTISEMQHTLLHNKKFFETLLLDITINVTEMFRDPSFFKTVRKTVIPNLKDRPFVKIWHAGCSSGEEVYSMAILLREEGICRNFRIYATDMNEAVIDKAKKGIFSIAKMKNYTQNYIDSGGKASFADYYTARYDFALMDSSLRKDIVFSVHNLVNDGVFGEMDLIVCRNVLIYLNKELKDRVFSLFWESLCPGGFLCVGSKETVRFSTYSDSFEDVTRKEKIYRKSFHPLPVTTGDCKLSQSASRSPERKAEAGLADYSIMTTVTS